MTVPADRTEPPAVVVNSLGEARQALAGVPAGGRIRLVSAPAAAASLGPAVFLALIARAAGEAADITVEAVLDCGEDPGFVLAAVRCRSVWAGPLALAVAVAPEVRSRLAEIAAAVGATVVPAPPPGGAAGAGAASACPPDQRPGPQR